MNLRRPIWDSRLLRLARWLGPWSSNRWPCDYRRHTVYVKDSQRGELCCWRYEPKTPAPVPGFLIAPGLHYAGPADPRFDRFCASLASAGFPVVAPFLPSYCSLRVDAGADADFLRVFDWLVSSGQTPGLFTISFGSRLGISVASVRSIPRLVIFGGYARLDAALRFAMTGETGGRRHGKQDPLNQPVLFLNLLDYLDNAPASGDARARLRQAWMSYARATWGRDEMKVATRYHAVAHSIARELPHQLRELFLLGCGVLPGSTAVLESALRASPFYARAMETSDIRCPVAVIHGADDDVIPFEQGLELAERLGTEAIVTGLYHHTGSLGLRSVGTWPRELATFWRALRAIAGVDASLDR